MSKSAAPPATTFVDAIDLVYDSTIPYDLRFFQALDHFVQLEPWLTRDKAMIDTLGSVWIEKGKPFAPDEATQKRLTVIQEAHARLNHRYSQIFTPFNEGHRWALPASPPVAEAMQSNFTNPDAYPIDDRAVSYSIAFFSAKHRRPFTIARPMGLIRDQKWSRSGSNTPALLTNADGSVDVYFRAHAPAGKESNWVPTNPNGRFEVLFRLYGPDKPFFDKTWILPDIEKMP